MLSIIIPVFGQEHYTEQIKKEIKDKVSVEHEIIILDGPEPVNQKRNTGVEQAKGEYIRIINNDLLLTKGLDSTLLSMLSKYKIACPYSTIGLYPRKLPLIHNSDNICGRCFMMKKQDRIPIPSEIQLWYGDNWVYEHSVRSIGRGGNVHHFGSKTIRSMDSEAIADRLEQDKQAWRKIEAELHKLTSTTE